MNRTELLAKIEELRDAVEVARVEMEPYIKTFHEAEHELHVRLKLLELMDMLGLKGDNDIINVTMEQGK